MGGAAGSEAASRGVQTPPASGGKRRSISQTCSLQGHLTLVQHTPCRAHTQPCLDHLRILEPWDVRPVMPAKRGKALSDVSAISFNSHKNLSGLGTVTYFLVRRESPSWHNLQIAGPGRESKLVSTILHGPRSSAPSEPPRTKVQIQKQWQVGVLSPTSAKP